MAKRRANKEGSMSKKADGTWQAQIPIGRDPMTGKMKRKSLYARSQAELKVKVDEFKNELKTGINIEASKLTLSQWLDTWLIEYKMGNVAEKTYESYEMLIRLYIKPCLGHVLVKELRPDDVQSFVNKLKNQGLSSRTVRYTVTVLHAVVDQAVNNNFIIRNVVDAVNLPKQEKKDIRILTPEQQKRFTDVLRQDRLGVAFILDLYTGLRRGELLALWWSDINLEKSVLKVNRSMGRVKQFDKEGKSTGTAIIIKAPKTKSGKRSIPLLAAIVKDLKRHKSKQLEEQLLAGDLYEKNDLVFCTEIGKPIEPRNFNRKFYELLNKAGMGKVEMPEGWKPGDIIPKDFKFPEWVKLPDGWKPGTPLPKDFKLPEPINLHALRHTFATRGLEQGIELKVMQELLGHAQFSLTADIYSHVLPEKKKEAIQKLKSVYRK